MNKPCLDTPCVHKPCLDKPRLELRPYQQECVDAIHNARERGRRRVLYVLPTGTGKTAVFSHLARHYQLPGRPALVLAHRDELIRQAADSIQRVLPEATVTIEKGDEKADPHSHVVLASVQTLARQDCKRLDWLAEAGPSLTIVDEAHHVAAVGRE